LLQSKDKQKSYWYHDTFDSFLVEEFVFSDPLVVPHLDHQLYEPTMRVAFFLIHNNHSIHIDFCGGYVRLPSKTLTETCTLNEKYRDIMKDPFYEKLDSELYENIKAELRIALPLLYEEMLKH